MTGTLGYEDIRAGPVRQVAQLGGRGRGSGDNHGMEDKAPPLTCERLAAFLESEGYPPASYGIGRHGKYGDQAVVLDRWGKRWVVYYTERGQKSSIRKHLSEDSACRDLLARLRGTA